MRQNLILFLTANMSAVISSIKENKEAYGITGNVTQSAVKAWMNNANTTEEVLNELATSLGWTPETAPVSTVAPTIEGVEKRMIATTTKNGEQIEVECYMLPVKNWDTSQVATLDAEQQQLVAKAREEGRYIQLKGRGPKVSTPVLKFNMNGQTVSAYSTLFRDSEVANSIKVGDILPVRVDSVNQYTGQRNGTPYIAYNGAVLESAVPALAEARKRDNERALQFSQMSPEAQKLVSNMSAEHEAKAFLAKFGK